METTMPDRSPKDLFTAHGTALSNGQIEGILALRNETSVLITSERSYRGKAEIGAFFHKLLAELPNPQWGSSAEVYHANVLYIDWTCKSDKHDVFDGVDTFVFEDGVIATQTARCTLALAKLNA